MYSPVIWDDGGIHNIVYETFYWTVGAGVDYHESVQGVRLFLYWLNIANIHLFPFYSRVLNKLE